MGTYAESTDRLNSGPGRLSLHCVSASCTSATSAGSAFGAGASAATSSTSRWTESDSEAPTKKCSIDAAAPEATNSCPESCPTAATNWFSASTRFSSVDCGAARTAHASVTAGRYGDSATSMWESSRFRYRASCRMDREYLAASAECRPNVGEGAPADTVSEMEGLLPLPLPKLRNTESSDASTPSRRKEAAASCGSSRNRSDARRRARYTLDASPVEITRAIKEAKPTDSNAARRPARGYRYTAL